MSDEKLKRLETIEKILDGAFYLTLNANDVFAWATAESCTFDINTGMDLLIEMVQRWGATGEMAFMAEAKGCEPQEPWFLPRGDRAPSVDRAQYQEAREFARGKPTGYCKWMDDVEKSDVVRNLKTRVLELEADVASHRDLQVRMLETLEAVGYDHEEQLAQGPVACVEHLADLVPQLEERITELETARTMQLAELARIAIENADLRNDLALVERRQAIIWERNVNLILLRVPDGSVRQAFSDLDVDTVGKAWTLKACEDAHKHSSNHRPEIERSKECACFYCLKWYSPSEIREWIDEHRVERNAEGKRVVHEVIGQTARCPRCGIDSVLGDASGFELTNDFMKAMRRRWFKQGTDSQGNEWEDTDAAGE